MGLPSPDSLSLSQAVALVMQRCNCSKRESKEALQLAGRDGRLDAAGLIPLSAHPNAKVREAHPHRRSESLRPADWGGQINWDTGKIGPYFSVSVRRLSIEAWLNKQTPSVTAEYQPRLAPDATIHSAISAEYDEADSAGRKPPNLKEIVKLVQSKLRNGGLSASGRRIQELAGTDRHAGRRRKPGPTLASDKRRL